MGIRAVGAAGVLTVALLASGCAAIGDSVTEAPAPAMTDVSKKCDGAFARASKVMNKHYKTHPMFGPEYDELYGDGTITKKEQKVLTAMIADEEKKFAKAIDPIYDACSGVEELYAGAFAHRDDADWALLDVPSMTREEIKKIFVVLHCFPG